MVQHSIDDLAGLKDDTGRLGRRVDGLGVFRPGPKSQIRVEGSDLYIEADYGAPHRWRKPTARLLDDFVRLWKSPDDTIAHFARQWGGLDVNSAGRPYTPPATTGAVIWKEPLVQWRFLSRRAYAILRIAERLNKEERGDKEDWKLLSSPGHGEPSSEFFGLPDYLVAEWEPSMPGRGRSSYKVTGPISIEHSRELIAHEVSGWMRRFGVAIQVAWIPTKTWRLEILYHGRFLAAIALQLALAISNSDSLFVCQNPRCEMPLYFRPKGMTGRAMYCDSCGESNKASLWLADKRRREKKAEVRRLASEGKTPSDIATLLDTKLSTVRSWIKKGK